MTLSIKYVGVPDFSPSETFMFKNHRYKPVYNGHLFLEDLMYVKREFIDPDMNGEQIVAIVENDTRINELWLLGYDNGAYNFTT